MAAKDSDKWSPGEYQSTAAFVPQLATKVVSWLDPQPNDHILDIGCGDGILNLEFAKILENGSGSVHGVDSSPAMIEGAKELCKGYPQATFEVLDASSQLDNLPVSKYDKVFSNAAMHWILRPPPARTTFFPSIARTLKPSGEFTFEMGGLGNVSEMRTALLLTLTRRIGLPAALAAEPWFFPDETWARAQFESAGFRVVELEREWRPTKVGEEGVEGWVRLFGRRMLESLEGGEQEREEVVRECGEVLREVCRQVDGGCCIGYVRLRGKGIKI